MERGVQDRILELFPMLPASWNSSGRKEKMKLLESHFFSVKLRLKFKILGSGRA